MTNTQIITAIIDAKRSEPYGNEQSFQLGYIVMLLAEIADHHPDVAVELQDRLTSLKGKK
jgi:pterin-4a-carbinolamine dehydratase